MRGKKWRVHVVPHTHWDREWYLPFQEMRVRLVRLVDEMCDAMAGGGFPGWFTLDGQMVVLEDYREGEGRRVEELKRLIGDGKVLVGPWYVLSDEFIPGEESLVRNLLMGRQLGHRWGGWMAEGYLPDSFGHPAQMPQILRGFGIESAVFWRGAGRDVRKSEFVWEGPDGSRVTAIYMPIGYCVAAALSPDRGVLVARAKRLREKLAPYATTQHLFFPAGCDHLELQVELGQLVEELNEADPEAHYELSTVPRLISSLREARRQEWQVRQGELRSGETHYVLAGTLSTRMYLKQRNWRTETLLYRHAEPMGALAMLLGGVDARPGLELAYKYLLSNHAHDSICGCSVDEVHTEMLERYRACEHVVDGVLEGAVSTIGACIDTAGGPEGVAVVVWNPCNFRRYERVVVEVELARRMLRKVDHDLGALLDLEAEGELPPAPSSVRVLDSAGVERRAALLESRVERRVRLFPHKQPELYETRVCRVEVEAEVPPFGLSTLYVSRAEAPRPRTSGDTLENEWLRVEVEERGTLSILHKATGRSYHGCHLLVDGGDAGDEYTWSPPTEDELVRPEEARWAIRGEGPWPELIVTYRLSLPRRLAKGRRRRSEARVDCTVVSRFRLWDCGPLLQVTTTMENLCEDHRLRVVFPTGAGQPRAWAGAPFQLVERTQPRLEDVQNWIDPVTTSPMQDLVSLGDGRGGLTVATRGLPEYELLPSPYGWAVAVTLLRSVGWLSRGDLDMRRGDAGWSLPTPGAQCPGTHQWEYAVLPYVGAGQREDSFELARAFTAPVRAFAVERERGHLPRTFSLFELEPPSLWVTALKPPQEGDGVVIRFHNPSSRSVQAVLRSHFPLRSVAKVRLDESPVEELTTGSDREVSLPVGPHEIVTLLLRVVVP